MRMRLICHLSVGYELRAPSCGLRGSLFAPRNSQFAARGSWLVARSSWLVARKRQRESERRTLSRRALQPDLPSVQLHEAARERQPQAGALLLARVVAPDLAKLLEQGRLVLRR